MKIDSYKLVNSKSAFFRDALLQTIKLPINFFVCLTIIAAGNLVIGQPDIFDFPVKPTMDFVVLTTTFIIFILHYFSFSSLPPQKKIVQKELRDNFLFTYIEKKSHSEFFLKDCWLIYTEHRRNKICLNPTYRNCSWLTYLLLSFCHV